MGTRGSKVAPLGGWLVPVALLLAACGGGTQGPQPPAPPSGVSATPGPGYVTVTWTDNSDDETGFRVLRSAAAGATTLSPQQVDEVGSVGENVTTFVDREVEVDQEYEYSVVAENEAGDSSPSATPASASVKKGVSLSVGTNNRRFDDEFNGTILVVHLVLPDELLMNEDQWTMTIVGPPGWNDDQPLVETVFPGSYFRERGIQFMSLNEITAVDGTYELTVDLPGESFESSTFFEDADFMLPAPAEIEATGDTGSVSVSWVSPAAGGSTLLSVWVGDYQEFVYGHEITNEDAFDITGLSLADGLYSVEVATINADLTTKFPVMPTQFGLSYETASFGVGQFYSPLCTSPDEEVAVPDEALRSLIADALEISQGAFTCEQMALLEQIDSFEAGVSSVEGLEYAPNLRELRLSGSDVEEITPLQDLMSLTALDLNGNPVTDIGPLEDLTNLNDLHLCCAGGEPFVDPTVFEALTKMEYFNIGDRQIDDELLAQIVAAMPDLKMLWLDGNQITDGSVFVGLEDLGHLAVGWNQIEDISFITEIPGLWSLELRSNPIADFAPLSEVNQLQVLVIADTGLVDISFLEDFTSLVDLDLADNQITDISALVANAGLGEGDIVNIPGNPLNLEDPEVMADIQALLDRGVDLTY